MQYLHPTLSMLMLETLRSLLRWTFLRDGARMQTNDPTCMEGCVPLPNCGQCGLTNGSYNLQPIIHCSLPLISRPFPREFATSRTHTLRDELRWLKASTTGTTSAWTTTNLVSLRSPARRRLSRINYTMSTLEGLIKTKITAGGGVSVFVSAAAEHGEKESAPEAAAEEKTIEEEKERNQEEGAKKEEESKVETVVRIAVEKKELVASFVAMRSLRDDDVAACEKELRKLVNQCEELLLRDGVEGYFVKKAPQSYSSKPTGLLELQVDEGIAIGDAAEDTSGERSSSISFRRWRAAPSTSTCQRRVSTVVSSRRWRRTSRSGPRRVGWTTRARPAGSCTTHSICPSAWVTRTRSRRSSPSARRS